MHTCFFHLEVVNMVMMLTMIELTMIEMMTVTLLGVVMMVVMLMMIVATNLKGRERAEQDRKKGGN